MNLHVWTLKFFCQLHYEGFIQRKPKYFIEKVNMCKRKIPEATQDMPPIYILDLSPYVRSCKR